MKQEHFREIQEALKSYEGCWAGLWLYITSLKQLHIRLKRYGEKLSADLVCYDCSRLQAQTGWNNAHIQIQETEPSCYAVFDPENGLSVECRLIVMHVNVEEPIV